MFFIENITFYLYKFMNSLNWQLLPGGMQTSLIHALVSVPHVRLRGIPLGDPALLLSRIAGYPG